MNTHPCIKYTMSPCKADIQSKENKVNTEVHERYKQITSYCQRKIYKNMNEPSEKSNVTVIFFI